MIYEGLFLLVTEEKGDEEMTTKRGGKDKIYGGKMGVGSVNVSPRGKRTEECGRDIHHPLTHSSQNEDGK